MFRKPVPVNVWYFWLESKLIVTALEDIKTSSMSLLPPHPHPDFSHYWSLQLSLICVCREKRSSCCRCSCREQHTHLFVSDRWPTERSSVCVFGYCAVGQLLYLPLVTLIWLCKLTQGTFLFNQAVVSLPRPPSWKNTYFIWRADWEPRAKTRWHHGLILVAFSLHANFWLPR